MAATVHPESGLSKATWTDQDLDAMSWNLCQIHALAVTDEEDPPGDLTPEEFLEQDDIDDTAPSADDRRDVTYLVSLVGHGVPAGAGFRLFQGEPEENCRVQSVHRRPALCPVTWVAGNSGPARDVGQHTGEPAGALVVDRARQAYGSAADPARGQGQSRGDRATATADRPLSHQRVGLGGGAAWHIRRTRDGDEGAAAAGEFVAEGREGRSLLCDRLRDGLGSAEIVVECQVDNAVCLGDAGTEDVQVGQVSPAAARRPRP